MNFKNWNIGKLINCLDTIKLLGPSNGGVDAKYLELSNLLSLLVLRWCHHAFLFIIMKIQLRSIMKNFTDHDIIYWSTLFRFFLDIRQILKTKSITPNIVSLFYLTIILIRKIFNDS